MSPEIRKNFKGIATLNEDDVSHAEEIVNIMKPLKTMTTVLCTEKEPTISLIFPMQSQIVQTFKESVTDSTVAKDIKAVIMKDIGSRYQDHDLKEFLCLASLLDPRFRSLPQLTDQERETVYCNLQARAADYVSQESCLPVSI